MGRLAFFRMNMMTLFVVLAGANTPVSSIGIGAPKDWPPMLTPVIATSDLGAERTAACMSAGTWCRLAAAAERNFDHGRDQAQVKNTRR